MFDRRWYCRNFPLVTATAALFPAYSLAQEVGGDGGAGGVISALLSLFLAAVAIAVTVAICFAIYLCYSRIPPEFRQMEPVKVFLLVIPCFNFYWNFVVFPGLARSYQNYFRSVGRTEFGDCGEKIGFWYAIAAVCCLIPLVNMIAWLAALGLLIVFLAKAFQLRSEIPEWPQAV